MKIKMNIVKKEGNLSPDIDTGVFLITETAQIVSMSLKSRTFRVGTERRNSGIQKKRKKNDTSDCE